MKINNHLFQAKDRILQLYNYVPIKLACSVLAVLLSWIFPLVKAILTCCARRNYIIHLNFIWVTKSSIIHYGFYVSPVLSLCLSWVQKPKIKWFYYVIIVVYVLFWLFASDFKALNDNFIIRNNSTNRNAFFFCRTLFSILIPLLFQQYFHNTISLYPLCSTDWNKNVVCNKSGIFYE